MAITLWIVLALGVLVLYALPLDTETTDLVSNGSFSLAAALIVAATIRAARREEGVDRIGWSIITVSVLLSGVLLGIDPSGSGETPTLALLAAPVVSSGFLVTVLLFGRHAISKVGLSRMVLDGVWLTAGVVVASWSTVVLPLLDGSDSGLELVAHSSFPMLCAICCAVSFLLMPHAESSSRVSLGLLGAGIGVVAVAASYNIVLGHEGTLEFGSWYDYLWIIGLGLLGIAALDIQVDGSHRQVLPSTVVHQLVTFIPIVFIAIPFLDGSHRSTPSILWFAMLVTLAGRVSLLISQNGDITDELEVLATYDELTGLLNRRALMDLLERDRVEVQRGAIEQAVLYIDLDDFKNINDEFGHAAGDLVLRSIADRMRETVRGDDVIARLGGDEFVVLVRRRSSTEAGTIEAGGRLVADRVQQVLTRPIEIDAREVAVGCSVGLTVDTGIPASELLVRADGALYLAKDRGGNLIITSDECETTIAG